MDVLNKSNLLKGKKLSCPFGRRCNNCLFIGEYAECPLTVEEKVYTELFEGQYEGVTPYDLFRRVRLSE